MRKKITKMQNGWNEWAQNSENPLAAVGRPLNNKELEVIILDISRKLCLVKSNRLLDVGCGSGVLLAGLKSSVMSVSGVDISPRMIEIAKDFVKGGYFSVSNADNLAFNDNLFDKIICYSVFHYFPDEKFAMKTIDEFLRVCKPGGKILIGDIPSKKHYDEIFTHVKKIKSFIKSRLKHLIRIFFGKPIKKGIHECYYIHKPKNWILYKLDNLCKYIESYGYSAKVLRQCDNQQWNTITYNYRFDILIEKTIQD